MHILIHTFFDVLALIPYLFITYFILEFIENKLNSKQIKILQKQSVITPILGATLSLIPQCGIAVMAATFYASRLISLGTLFAVFLSLSDEMIPVLISNKMDGYLIICILIFKVCLASIIGILVDLFITHKNKKTPSFSMNPICTNCHCHDKKGILKSTFYHTVHVSCIIFIILFIFNALTHLISIESLKNVFNTPYSELFASLFGIIPSCATSVLLTQLFALNTLPLSALISGLLINAGLGFIVLFQVNKPMKQNFYILMTLFCISLITGLLLKIIA